jgi:hypothetical protein
VESDAVWGGWKFHGRILRPGALVEETDIPRAGLVLECAGSEGGSGHTRGPTRYILWRWDRLKGDWRHVAESAAVGRDWTIDLGPIVQRELDPPRPFLVDPQAAAGRLIAAISREIAPLEFSCQVLVIRAVQDRLAGGLAG